MIYLLDTHRLLWSSFEPERPSAAARELLNDSGNEFAFSSASIWEVAIKAAKHPHTFLADPERLREGLVDLGYREVDVTSPHAVLTRTLPALHRDPFDRILIAQTLFEGLVIARVDEEILRYRVPHRDVR